jgi:RNA polymerase sigma factor (sigma-70 family)
VFQSTRAPTVAAREQVAEELAAHEGLVRWVVRRQRRGGLRFDDAVHAGRLGLWRALLGYDPGRGTRFRSYAVPAIRRAVWAAVAEQRLVAPPPAVPPPVPAVEWLDPVETLAAAEVQAAVRALVAQLPPAPRWVVVAHHGLDGRPPETFAAIGRALGVSRQRAHQVYAVALRHLAQPAHSLALRRLLGRDGRADYRQALARQRRAARAGRRRSGGRR